MPIVPLTGDLHALMARFDGPIAARETAAWATDRFGNDVHDVPHWHSAAALDPFALGDGLRSNLRFVDERPGRRFCFAERHGAMLQAVPRRRSGRFPDAGASREPGHGDEPLEAASR